MSDSRAAEIEPMDCRTIVFNAARDGKLTRLKVFVEELSPAEALNVISSLTYNTPPLVIAARNGHLPVVLYLLDKGADVRQTGTVTFDGEPVEAAPAIWAAAAAGHLEIVQLLVGRGADVNQTTATSSSALRGACYDGHLHIVEYLVAQGADIELANRNRHTPLMIASYRNKVDVVKFLLSKRADTNRQSVLGNTCLHDAADAGSVPVTRLLLSAGARVKQDRYGLTPLLAAALLGNTDLVQFYIKECGTTVSEACDALRLLGATAVDKHRDAAQAVAYWRAAIRLSSAFPQKTYRIMSEPVAAVYECEGEVATETELDDLLADPDALRMQSLLIRERVVGGRHPDTFYYLRYRAAIYADIGLYDRCCALWMHALTLQQRAFKPLNSSTLASLVAFVELYQLIVNEMQQQQQPYLQAQAAVWHDRHAFASCMADTLVAAVNEMQRHVDGEAALFDDDDADVFHAHDCECNRDTDENVRRLFSICLSLVALIRLLYAARSTEQIETSRLTVERRVNSSVRQLVGLGVRAAGGLAVTHVACSESSNCTAFRQSATVTIGGPESPLLPSLPVLRLLVEAGADVNVRDGQGNTCLQTLLANAQVSSMSLVEYLLRNTSIHVDTTNTAGQSALSRLAAHNRPEYRALAAGWRSNTQTLVCLAATAVKQYGLPYKTLVPSQLEFSIQLH